MGTHLARHEIYRLWRFIDEFLLTPSGEIQKFVLRERFQNEETEFDDAAAQ